MEKFCFSPMRAPSLRSMRTPRLWKVLTARSLRGARPDQRLGALAHFLRRLVGEGDGRDLLRLQPGLQQPRDLVHDDARLARAGAGQHQAGAGEVVHGLHLGGVQGDSGGRHRG